MPQIEDAEAAQLLDLVRDISADQIVRQVDLEAADEVAHGRIERGEVGPLDGQLGQPLAEQPEKGRRDGVGQLVVAQSDLDAGSAAPAATVEDPHAIPGVEEGVHGLFLPRFERGADAERSLTGRSARPFPAAVVVPLRPVAVHEQPSEGSSGAPVGRRLDRVEGGGCLGGRGSGGGCGAEQAGVGHAGWAGGERGVRCRR